MRLNNSDNNPWSAAVVEKNDIAEMTPLDRYQALTYGSLFVTGAIIELSVTLATGAKESWDTEIYWSIGLPVMFIANGIAGFSGRGRNIAHGIVTVSGQWCAMMAVAGEIGSMVVPGIIVSILLGTVVSAGSFGGKAVRNYFHHA